MFGLFSKKKPSLRAVIDVGSHSIKAMLFSKEGSSPPRILKKMVLKLPLVHDEKRVVVKLRELLFTMVRQLERVPEEITVGLGSNITHPAVRVLGIRPPGKVKNISRKDLGSYFQTLLLQNRDQERAVLAYPLNILINGYAVRLEKDGAWRWLSDGSAADVKRPGDNLLRLPSVEDLSYRTLMLYFSDDVGQALEEMKMSLGGMPITFMPLILAEYHAIGRVLGLHDFLMVDVGGEGTYLGFVKGGELVGVSSFPLGGRHFLRGIAKITSLSFPEAEDVRRQYIQGMVSEAKKNQLREYLRTESQLWSSLYMGAIESFYHLGPLPETILLFGGGANLPEIMSFLRDPAWSKDYTYVSAPALKLLDASEFFEGDTLGGFLRGPEEVGLASLMTYSLHHESLW